MALFLSAASSHPRLVLDGDTLQIDVASVGQQGAHELARRETWRPGRLSPPKRLRGSAATARLRTSSPAGARICILIDARDSFGRLPSVDGGVLWLSLGGAP